MGLLRSLFWKRSNKDSAYYKTIERYKECGIQYYTFRCYLEYNTCSVCGKMDGKSFRVSDAVAGVNLPPLHDGCCCYIGPKLERDVALRLQRAAQISPYEKGLLNWTQWREMFVEGREQEYEAVCNRKRKSPDRSQSDN